MCRCLRLVFLIVAVPLGLAVGVQGCGGDDSTGMGPGATETTDSGVAVPDATESDSLSTPDMASADVLVASDSIDSSQPANPGDALCVAEQQFYQRCNLTSPCQQQNLAACSAQQKSFSAGAVQAAVACLPTNSCDLDGGNKQNIACFEQHLATATPTAAQRAVAVSFCAQCRPDAGAASCESAFFDIAGDASNNIIGFLLLEVNDTTATNIENACTGAFLDDAGSPLGCTARFFVCADRLALLSSPGDACKASDGGEKG